MDMPLVALAHLPVGASAVAVSLGRDTPALRRLADMGLVPGTEVWMVRRAPLGDPLQLRLRGSTLTVRRSDAMEVLVRCAT